MSCSICVVVLLWYQTAGVSSAAAQADLDSPPENASGLICQAGAEYIGLGIPRRIVPAELGMYQALLDLSDEQAIALRRLFDNYIVADRELKRSRIQSIWDRGATISADSGASMTIDGARAVAQLFAEVESEWNAIESIEEGIWTGLVPLLTEQQLEYLPLARHLRERIRLRSAQPSSFAGSTFDMVFQLLEMSKMTEQAELLHREGVRAIMIQYDASATSLERERWRARCKCAADGSVLLARKQDHYQRGEFDQAAMVDSECRALNKRALTAARRIHELNKTYVTILQGILPSEAATTLRRSFDQAAYKPVYPNPYAIESLVEAIMSDEQIGDDKLRSIAEIVNAHNEHISTLENEMIACYLKWREEIGFQWGYSHDGYEAYQQEMRSHQQGRREQAEQTLRLILDVMGSEMNPKVREKYDSWTASAKAWDTRLSRPNVKWPMPYD